MKRKKKSKRSYTTTHGQKGKMEGARQMNPRRLKIGRNSHGLARGNKEGGTFNSQGAVEWNGNYELRR